MPVDLTFFSDIALTAEIDLFVIEMMFGFDHTIWNVRRGQLVITPDSTEPVEETEWNVRMFTYTDPMTSETSQRFKCLVCLPYNHKGTMTVVGEGRVFRVDTNDFDMINSGSATIAYDTRIPIIANRDIPDKFEHGQPYGQIFGLNRDVKMVASNPADADESFEIEGAMVDDDMQLYAWTLTDSIPRVPLPADLLTDTVWTVDSDPIALNADFTISMSANGYIRITLTSNGAGTIVLTGEDTGGSTLKETLTFTNDLAGRVQTTANPFGSTADIVATPSGFTAKQATYSRGYIGGFVLATTTTFAQYWAVHTAAVGSTAEGTVQITLRDDAVETSDSSDAVFAISDPVPPPQPQMAQVPDIERVGTQNLILTEAYDIEIDIQHLDTDDADNSVTVDGLLRGNYYDWDNSTGTLHIRGTADQLLTDKIWLITAENPNGSSTYNVQYNYVEREPVVTALARQTLYRGGFNEVLIPVANGVGDAEVEGLLVGLEQELIDQSGDGINDHVRVFGVPNQEANFTVTRGQLDVMASNTGGDDMATTEFDLEQDIPLFAFNNFSDSVYRIAPDGTLAWTNTELAATSGALSSSDGAVYSYYSDRGVRKIGQDGILAWTYTGLPSALYDIPVASSDGHVFFYDPTERNIYKITSDGTQAWANTNSFVSSRLVSGTEKFFASSDGGVFLYFIEDQNVSMVDADGDVDWTYSVLPSQNYSVVASSDGGVFAYSTHTRDMYKIDADGSLDWTYTTLPGQLIAYDAPIASSDGGVFAFRDDIDDMYKIDKDGNMDFTYTGLPNAVYDAPIASSDGGVFVFNEVNENIYKIDSNGTLAWSSTLPTGAYAELVAANDGGVFALRIRNNLGQSDSTVYRLNSDGTLAWTSTALPQTQGFYEPFGAFFGIPIIFGN